MKLKIIANIGRWDTTTFINDTPLVVDIEGLPPRIEWHYQAIIGDNRANGLVDGRSIKLATCVGELNLTLTGYIRGKKVMQVFAEPLLIAEPSHDINRFVPEIDELKARIVELSDKINGLAEFLKATENAVKSNTDRIEKIENEYDILKV